MQNKMDTIIIYRVYIGIMEKKMETAIMGSARETRLQGPLTQSAFRSGARRLRQAASIRLLIGKSRYIMKGEPARGWSLLGKLRRAS